ncbi:IS110 family transposase [Salibacterium aidingense]
MCVGWASSSKANQRNEGISEYDERIVTASGLVGIPSITHVAMESSGVYWKPVWNVLEGAFTCVLANAQRIKNVPGRKTDVSDAAWIAQLQRCGLITPSFVPSEDLRNLRDLTRYHRKFLGNATAEKNRIHKILQDANI